MEASSSNKNDKLDAQQKWVRNKKREDDVTKHFALWHLAPDIFFFINTTKDMLILT